MLQVSCFIWGYDGDCLNKQESHLEGHNPIEIKMEAYLSRISRAQASLMKIYLILLFADTYQLLVVAKDIVEKVEILTTNTILDKSLNLSELTSPVWKQWR